ncbi:hypothetical protein [Candidatus Uabimicrobium sp. HlEnr_7]|uniref:hypothetical protein n=1 Tax=Candidatus Uabimicrobium helgolandensis TaxID=3095367 RepID=UPI003558F7A6
MRYIVFTIIVMCAISAQQINTSFKDDIKLSLKSSKITFLNKQVFLTVEVENLTSTTIKNIDVQIFIPDAFESVLQATKISKKQKFNWKITQLKSHKTKTFKVLLRALRDGNHLVKVLILQNRKILCEKKIGISVLGHHSREPRLYDTNDPIAIGEKTTYVFTAKNLGSSECTKVWVINHIPQQMEFVLATGPTEYWYDPKKKVVIFAPLTIILPGQKEVYKITCKAIEAGNTKNIVKVYYDQFSRAIINEESTDIYK